MQTATDQASPAFVELTVDQALREAINHHRSGRLRDAECLYRAILQAQPKHPDANHNLGLLATSIGKPDAALPFLKTALEANLKQGQFWVSYIDALIRANRLDTARQVLEQGRQIGLQGDVVDKLNQMLLMYPHFDEPTSCALEVRKSLSSTGKRKIALAKKEKRKAIPKVSKDIRSVRQLAPSDAEIDALIRHYKNRHYEIAKNRALEITKVYPRHPVGWKVLGATLKQMGGALESLAPMQKTIELTPGDALAHSNLGVTLNDLGRHEEAEASHRQAIALKPDYAEAHGNLGITLNELGRHEEAEASYRQAIALKPGYAEAYGNLGNVLRDLGRLKEAEASYRQAIALKPGYAEAYGNLGVALNELGRHDEAEASYRQAIALKPGSAEAYGNLGNVLRDLGRHDEAEGSYRQAIALKPGSAEAYGNLGVALNELGRLEEAEASYRQAITLKPDFLQGKFGYAHCIAAMRFNSITPSIYATTATAISEVWTRPSSLARVACNLLLLNPAINKFFVPDTDTGLFQKFDDAETLEQLGNDSLLHALLTSVPIPDDQLERLLTDARHLLLNDALKSSGDGAHQTSGIAFFGALAQQCFLNEYVFSCLDEEIQAAIQLRDLLADALRDNVADIPPLWVMGVACYFPLWSVARSETLLERPWPDEIKKLLTQQIREPLEELKLRPSIPLLTPIDNGVSAAVRSQYEENPYPRWNRAPQEGMPKPIDVYLRAKFPKAKILPPENCQEPDVLIAGCGTGQHPISTAQNIRGANVLAVDLSTASLSYAKRKSQEMGIRNIEYAQADILKLDTLGRTFDVIESCGVLHHLEKPLDGWQRLLSLLRPNGFFRLGFYSEIARRSIVRARDLISQKCYNSKPSDIRAARQWLREMDRIDSLGQVIRSADFYSISTCRDLLFHVQEHRMTLELIHGFIVKNGLTFLGFEIDSSVARSYRLRFPDDQAATSLENWQVFERENPDTFSRMYQFWIQK